MYRITIHREDPDTGEEIAIDLEVEILRFYPGSIPHPLAISPDYGELELGEIYRADTGERFELTDEEFEWIKEEIWDRLRFTKPDEEWY